MTAPPISLSQKTSPKPSIDRIECRFWGQFGGFMKRLLGRQSTLKMVLAGSILVAGVAQPWKLVAQAPQPATGVKYAQIAESDMKEWLTYLSSDELQGRQVFTEGYGLAAQYIAEHLKQWGIKPVNPDGSY